MKKYDYRTIVVSENSLFEVFIGGTDNLAKKLEAVMDQYGSHGWRLVGQIVEFRRKYLLFKYESIILTFERESKEEKS